MPSSLVYEPWYTTGAVDGLKKSARYVPVSSRITNDHSAISPSMNVQWSGKTLRISVRTPRAPPNRSSSQPPTPLTARGTSAEGMRPRSCRTKDQDSHHPPLVNVTSYDATARADVTPGR